MLLPSDAAGDAELLSLKERNPDFPEYSYAESISTLSPWGQDRHTGTMDVARLRPHVIS